MKVRVRKLLVILIIFLSATSLNSDSKVLMSKMSIFVDKEKLNINQIKSQLFQAFTDNHHNFGFNNKINIWLKLEINNNTNLKADKLLDLNNPLLEEIVLYDGLKVSKSGMLNITDGRTTISPVFDINIPPKTNKVYYVKIQNTTTALQFSVNLEDKKVFSKKIYKNSFLL